MLILKLMWNTFKALLMAVSKLYKLNIVYNYSLWLYII